MSFVPKISTSGSVYMPIVLVSWLVLAHEIMSYEEFRINFKISMNQTSVRHRAQTLEHTLTRETTFRYFSEDSNNDTLTTHSTSDKITRPPNHSLKSSHVIPKNHPPKRTRIAHLRTHAFTRSIPMDACAQLVAPLACQLGGGGGCRRAGTPLSSMRASPRALVKAVRRQPRHQCT